MTCMDTCCRPEHDIEYRTLGTRQIGATRKPHTCDSCGEEIPVGSPCRTVTALVDGDFWSVYLHRMCD
jgi:hypothetical protein